MKPKSPYVFTVNSNVLVVIHEEKLIVKVLPECNSSDPPPTATNCNCVPVLVNVKGCAVAGELLYVTFEVELGIVTVIDLTTSPTLITN